MSELEVLLLKKTESCEESQETIESLKLQIKSLQQEKSSISDQLAFARNLSMEHISTIEEQEKLIKVLDEECKAKEEIER